MARALAREHGLTHLDLDEVTWESPGVRRTLEESSQLLDTFASAHSSWVIEGCYGSLIEGLLPICTELRFLNPGVDACAENCRKRPWEPHKYRSREDQDRMFDFLVDWVRAYETREDEYSLSRHRSIFDGFGGPKREFT